jgi:cobalt-zinc-cadmium resistance protein CzcA
VIATHGGVPIRVRDVARVVDGREIRRGAVTADGKGEVVLGLGFMLMGENSHEVTERLEARLAEVRRPSPRGPSRRRCTTHDARRPGARHGQEELARGRDPRHRGPVHLPRQPARRADRRLAIPLSMLFAFDLMLRAGIAGSLMSLGAIDFGLVVDSSVIMIENSVRRLGRGPRAKRLEVVRDAALEVRKPTMFGELIIMIVYLPILALEGVEGKLFRPMALTVIFALLGSMVLSLTLMPVLASLLLPRVKLHERRFRGPRPQAQGVSARARLRAALALGRLAAAALLLLANAAFMATRLGSEFVPASKRAPIVVNTVRLAGVSRSMSRSGTGRRSSAAPAERFPDEIERVWTRTGTAEVATDPMGLEVSDVFITLTPRSAGSAGDTRTSSSRPWRRSLSSAARHQDGLHAADRDARERDGRWRPQRPRREAVRR